MTCTCLSLCSLQLWLQPPGRHHVAICVQALQLHLEASHERFAFQFSEDEPGIVPEIYVDVVTAPEDQLSSFSASADNARKVSISIHKRIKRLAPTNLNRSHSQCKCCHHCYSGSWTSIAHQLYGVQSYCWYAFSAARPIPKSQT